MVRWSVMALVAVLAACAADAPAPTGTTRLEPLWSVGDLANPESVALSDDGALLYVTNVNGEGEAKDGNGFISRVSVGGELIEREWARGLNAPKGIARAGDLIYVADIDRMVVIDTKTAAVRGEVAVAGARFLNDLAIAPDGGVLIADSGGSRIYVVAGGKAEIWLEHPLLASVNGLLPEPRRLVVTTMAGRLLAVDYATKAITVLAEGLGDADGIARLQGGRYLVSEWPGLMHVVAPDGGHVTIMDTRAERRLLNDFLLVGDTLYQPHWEPGELTAYRIVQTSAK